MGMVRCSISVSLDGYVAGPNQGKEFPVGEGGERLHEWMFATAAWARSNGLPPVAESPDSSEVDDIVSTGGAFIMGRRMFGPDRGEWDLSWRGWWGDDPPYHAPTFVLCHRPRASIEMEGGTTFHFVTGGIEAALEQARAAARSKDVMIAGGAQTVDQFLRAGYIDELNLHLVPVLLGGGERLFQDAGNPRLRIERVIASPAVTHLRYRPER